MEAKVTEIGRRIAALTARSNAEHREIEAILTLARDLEEREDKQAGAGELLELAGVIGRIEQARHGQLIRTLAQVDQIGGRRAGLIPWISANLDASNSRARGIAQAARRIGHLPELAEPLSSGRIGSDTVRALTRTARAIQGTDMDHAQILTETLQLAEREGVAAVNKQVRVLEETIQPGRAEELLAKQRARSFMRILEIEGGMCRIEALLDPERATTLRAAIDQLTSTWIRAHQYDGKQILPEDVRSIEQIQAQALTRLAEVFLTAAPEQREASFTPPTLYHAPLHEAEGTLAESAYGDMVPRTVVAARGNSAAHLIEHVDGQPVLLDGKSIDENPAARLASPAQRTALAFRDRHCTYEGCSRPPTWSLNAHHKIPYGEGGPTTLQNLTLLCAEHHTLTHQQSQTQTETETETEARE